jgi:NitT/TauT family transport system substrate-binding protein
MPDLMLRVETLLQGKDIDAAILPDPLASFAIAQGGISVIDDTTLDENFSQSVFLATDDFITNHQPTLDAFMDVLFQAMTDINENPDTYRDLLMEKANVPETLRDTYPMPTYTPGAVPTEQQVARLESWLVEKQLLDKVYSYHDLVDTSYVTEAEE